MALKIGFLGLDAAGKSAFLAALSKTYTHMIDAKPTKGIERSEKNIMGQVIGIWDYGGQKAYRDRYLKSERDLEDLSLIYYLVDIQNPERLNESVRYLSDLLDKMKTFDQGNLIICFHKHDPDKRDALKDRLNAAWERMESVADDAYAFLPTSIFDEASILRAFSMGLRKVAVKEDIVGMELRNIWKETGSKAAVILTSDGYAISSQAPDDVIAEEVEAIGMSLVVLWKSIIGEFDEILGTHSIGDFRFDKVTAGGRDYFLLIVGTRERIASEKILPVLEMIS
ncbi:MAG: ADP-ribosylation factor-like protein [Candidatus Heimdallarchaeota archaeon]